jgi:hypothetical protein
VGRRLLPQCSRGTPHSLIGEEKSLQWRLFWRRWVSGRRIGKIESAEVGHLHEIS